MLKRAVLMGAMVLAVMPTWAAYKCVGVDGAVAFQDGPCDGQGQKLDLPKKPAAVGAPGKTDYDKLFQENLRRLEAQQAIADRQIKIGMTAEEVVDIWGRPSAINSTVTGAGRSEQWVYRRGSYRTQYVYFTDGLVRSFQDNR